MSSKINLQTCEYARKSSIFQDNQLISYKKSVSPLRVYYTNRNIIYVNKKLNKYGSIGYENYNCKGYLGFIISFMIPSILRAQDKKSVLKATIQGVCDGKRSKPGEWSAEI